MYIGNIKLGLEGEKLLKLYAEKLGITSEDACKIFKQNNTALSLLEDELALNFTGTDRILSALMRATILREFYDFEKLRPAEIKLIKEHYDITIKKVTRTKLKLHKSLGKFDPVAFVVLDSTKPGYMAWRSASKILRPSKVSAVRKSKLFPKISIEPKQTQVAAAKKHSDVAPKRRAAAVIKKGI